MKVYCIREKGPLSIGLFWLAESKRRRIGCWRTAALAKAAFTRSMETRFADQGDYACIEFDIGSMEGVEV